MVSYSRNLLPTTVPFNPIFIRNLVHLQYVFLVLANCGAGRDWPDARGIFHNNDKTFLVWVNEEDHIRCISMQNGGNVKEVFARWARAINSIEASLKAAHFTYAYDNHLGYITTCPSNCGTGLRASVMLKLPKLYKKMGVHALEDMCDSMGLQARGSRGEHSPPGYGPHITSLSF